MPVCGSVGGGRASGSGMGYHGNILLKTNVGEGEAFIYLFIYSLFIVDSFTIEHIHIEKKTSSSQGKTTCDAN